MTIEKAVKIGISGNEISKKITGTSEVSASRSIIAAGSGAALGAAASGAVAIGSTVLGIASAPIAFPLATISAGVAFLASLFDY